MKRICITINFFPFSGGARAIVSEVWRALHEKYDIHFLSIPPADYSGSYTIHRLQRMRRHTLPCNPGLFPLNLCYMLWGIIRLLQLNKKYQFDAVLAQDGVFTGFYSTVAGRLTGRRVVIMDYGATTNFLSSAYWNFQVAVRPKSRLILLSLHSLVLRGTALVAIRATARMSTKLAVLGYELSEIYRRMNVPESKIGTVKYSVDEKFFSPLKEGRETRRLNLNIPADSIVVNATCRLSQEKGIEYLMPALRQALEENDKIVCLIVGMGRMYEYVSRFIRENDLEQKIRLLGDAPPRKVRDLLQISDIFIYAGVSGSNVSLAVLEAMSIGCAVVATNSPRSHENLLADGRGIVVSVKDSSAIAKSIILLAEDAELRKQMGENARKWVVENHSLKALRESIESLLVS